MSNEWQMDWLIDLLFDWLTEWLTDWLTDLMTDWKVVLLFFLKLFWAAKKQKEVKT